MITNKILLLRREASINKDLVFPTGTEFHIVMDVVYMRGLPVPFDLQSTVYQWISNNPTIFTEIFR